MYSLPVHVPLHQLYLLEQQLSGGYTESKS